MKLIPVAIAAAAAALAVGQAYASPLLNEPPPAGTVIYQLTGQTISGTYQLGTASFVAGSANTNLAFAFREDSNFIRLSDVAMVDASTHGPNLVLNGDFGLGPLGSHAPTDWSYLNTSGATFLSSVGGKCGLTNNNCYSDFAGGAYDAINQVIATTIGDTYTVSFYYADPLGAGTYQPIAASGAAGRDMFVYAGQFRNRHLWRCSAPASSVSGC